MNLEISSGATFHIQIIYKAFSNLGKHKFFFWLLLRDMLNTRHLLRRKNMEFEDYRIVVSCVIQGKKKHASISSLFAPSIKLVGTLSLSSGI
jgi:hypothetical protein